MSGLVREMRGAFAFVERNINLMKRYWGWEVAAWRIACIISCRRLSYSLLSCASR